MFHLLPFLNVLDNVAAAALPAMAADAKDRATEMLTRFGLAELSAGSEVRLKHAYFITCDEVVKDAAGEVVTPSGSRPDLWSSVSFFCVAGNRIEGFVVESGLGSQNL